jgi:hypothetical protein
LELEFYLLLYVRLVIVEGLEFIMAEIVAGLACPYDPESYAGGNAATGSLRRHTAKVIEDDKNDTLVHEVRG